MAKLYVVSTPIGNLGDITLRALETLKMVDIVACEDTRHTLQLLNHFELKKSLVSYHEHSKDNKIEQIIDSIIDGKNVAVVTDAGTPGISDPGERLIKLALERGVEIEPIPGVSAAITALSISGLSTDEFVFIGFLPHKKGRQTKLKQIATEKRTIILYESPFRIIKLLNELLEFVGDREVSVSRELTKKFEETYRGKISDIIPNIKEKGEFVIVINGHEKTTKSRIITNGDTDIVFHECGEADKISIATVDNCTNLLFPELSYNIQGIAQDIRNDYGSGQKESIYQNAFAEALEAAGIIFEKEKAINIHSINTGKVLGQYRPDFVVDGKILLELKAVSFLPKTKESQLFDYLKNSEYELGYIINFGGNKLYCKRIIFTEDYKNKGVGR